MGAFQNKNVERVFMINLKMFALDDFIRRMLNEDMVQRENKIVRMD